MATTCSQRDQLRNHPLLDHKLWGFCKPGCLKKMAATPEMLRIAAQRLSLCCKLVSLPRCSRVCECQHSQHPLQFCFLRPVSAKMLRTVSVYVSSKSSILFGVLFLGRPYDVGSFQTLIVVYTFLVLVHHQTCIFQAALGPCEWLVTPPCYVYRRLVEAAEYA